MMKQKDGSDKDESASAEIDRNLRRVYDDILDDELPDRFEELLRRLREQDSSK